MQPSHLRFRHFAAVLACSFAVSLPTVFAQNAANTATTDPVGFITLRVDGTAGAGTSKISFKGLGLTRPVEYQGSAETVGTNTLTDNEATWTDNQFNGANGAYVAEVTSGPGAGTSYDISATNAANKTITLAQNLGTGVANGVTFKVRKHWTIASAFGANNEAGLAGGDDSSTADQLLIWNGTGFNPYYYQVAPAAAGGTGWRSPTNVFGDAGTTVIYPDDGIVVRRIQSANVDVVLMGAVKIGQTSVPIQAGINIVANVYAAPLTLQSSGLQASGLTGGDDPSTADQVLIWNGTGYSPFYYQIAPAAAGGTGWRSPTDVFADAGGTQIPVGSSVVVKRSFGTAFDWKIPQHPASL